MDEYGVVVEPETVRFERLLPGPIERVWSYLTDSDRRGSWFASGVWELRPGGKVELIFHNSALTENDEPPPEKFARYDKEIRGSGRITVCEPPRRIAFTWDEATGEDTEVTFELTPRGDRVLLRLTHRRLASRADMLGVCGGWHTHLEILSARLEDREPAGFWATLKRLDAEYDRRLPAE
jgi:uncharacterized protein YndB with AHSA1/START domain